VAGEPGAGGHGRRFGDATWRVEADGCGESGTGSAFAIAPDLVVTNAHVVAIDPNPTLVSRNGEEISGSVIGWRAEPDVAVIRTEGPLDSWLEWAPTEELIEGQQVIALTYPTPLLSFTVAPGTLLSFQVEDGRRIAIASDEVTDFGSSGGPLLDDRGRVVGIVTEFAAGDGRQVIGLSYTYDHVWPAIEEIVAAPEDVDADCLAFVDPVTYGDDPFLDELWDACELGDFDACDELFTESPVGSDYEHFADTCGDRNEPGEWCTDRYGT
jgi:S1-C subfamily serine protease